jgi:hypothetical protein
MIMRVSAQGQAYGYLGAREQLGSGARFPLLHCPKARADDGNKSYHGSKNYCRRSAAFMFSSVFGVRWCSG